MAEFLVLILAILLFSAIATLAIYAVGLCLAGCVAYAILVHVIIPLCGWLLTEGEKAAKRVYRWYREVTWAYRASRAQQEALVAMDRVRREQVDRVRMIAQELDRYEAEELALEADSSRTADETVAVPLAVRGR
jgi:hypothetical protein